MQPVVFVDMDGVLTDFVGHACEQFKCMHPGINDPHNFLFGHRHKGLFYHRMDYDFWVSMPALNRHLIDALSPFETYVLTATIDRSGCLQGKADWIAREYPSLVGRVIPTAHKHLLAAPGRFLIDDNVENCLKFLEAGGRPILYPHPWNNVPPANVLAPFRLTSLKEEDLTAEIVEIILSQR